jgi:nickel-dependent lactate racemase
MRVKLPYGRSFFDLSLDHRWDLVPSQEPTSLPNTKESLLKSLENPIASPPLQRLISGRTNVTIIVSDRTRPTGALVFLPPLLEVLNVIGIPDQKITLLFSLGIHSPQTPAQQAEIIGPYVAARYRAIDHNCQSVAANSYVGTTQRGIRVSLNCIALKSDFVIVTGSIGFHYLAGFSGGRKSIVPGISSHETCVSWHRLSLDSQGRRHSQARTRVLAGNPLHEESVGAIRFLPPSFLVNTALNDKREIVGFFSGDLIQAHEEGCRNYEKSHVVEIDGQREAAIITCGGHPRDLNFIQVHKAIEHATGAVREGGMMVVVAECAQGIGNPTFLSWFDHPSLAAMEENLTERFEINGQTALSMRTKAKRFKILLLSRLNPEDVIKMGMQPIRTLDQGIRILLDYLGKNDRGWVIPDAITLLPRVRN